VRRGYHADLAARYRQDLVEVGSVAAPAEVADAFGVADATPLVVRRHIVRSDDVRGDDQQPVEVGASWFLPADASGTSLVRVEAYGRPLFQEVEDETGRRYATAEDRLSARLPTREEAEQLHIRPDTPVLHLLHIAYDDEHRPIEVAQATWPGPMTTITESYPVPAPLIDTDDSPG
jgi:GntR family transcriptional regulator